MMNTTPGINTLHLPLPFLLLTGLLLACGGSDSQGYGGSAPCDPGATRACVCPDGSESQKVCADSGRGYHACACADVTIEPGDTTGQADGAQGDGVTPPTDTGPTPDGCAPACAGKDCGPDGCGGQCGACAGGSLCAPDGTCQSLACGGNPTIVSGALTTELGAVDFDHALVSVSHKRDVDVYEDGCIVEVHIDLSRGDGCHFEVTAAEKADPQGALIIQQMMLSADSQCPGFPDDKEGVYTVKGELVMGDVAPGLAKVPDSNAAESCFHSVITVRLAGLIRNDASGSELNLASSTLLVEGDFTSAGLMSASCPCVMSCEGKGCGSDGCSGSCGACGCGEVCDAGLCRFIACDQLACGPDGCGGTCGGCTEHANSFCTSQGACDCMIDCSSKDCGDNGCGGSCGACPANYSCEAGECVPGPCAPACVGKECGPDGCGGSCGACPAGEGCQSGQCVAIYDAGCETHSGPTCGGCACQGCVCGADPYCCDTKWDATCVNECKQCGSCGGCQADCAGKVCGSDGCGGSCGSCAAGLECDASGQCAEPADPGDFGKSCETNADCAAGLDCMSFDLVGFTFCSKACTPLIGTECPTGWSCMPNLLDTTQPGICINMEFLGG